MPLMILLVGGGLTIVSSQLSSFGDNAVRDFTEELCQKVRSGRDVSAMLNNPDLLVTAQTVTQLNRTFAANLNAADYTFTIHAGDVKDIGDDTATHHVVIYILDQPQIGLRLMHRVTHRDVVVLGYWIPDNSQ